jgi:hypothetical protein
MRLTSDRRVAAGPKWLAHRKPDRENGPSVGGASWAELVFEFRTSRRYP